MHIIIHCGLHKTGTTSFQTQVYHATSELMSAGVYYPPPIDRNGIVGQHSQVAMMLMRGARSTVTEYLEQVALNAEKYRWLKVLMSGEEFSSLHADPAVFDHFRDELVRIFGSYEFVVVLRNLASHTASHLMQDTFEGRIVLSYKGQIAVEARKRLMNTCRTVRFFGSRSDVRLLDYSRLLQSTNFCNALLKELLPDVPVEIADVVDNTFDDKIAEIERFALASVRSANTLINGPKADLSAIVDMESFKSSFKRAGLVRFSSRLKKTVTEITEEVIGQEEKLLRDQIGHIPLAVQFSGLPPQEGNVMVAV